MNRFFTFLKKSWPVILTIAVIMAIVGFVEYHNGRLPLGPDGRFGWWDGNIWGNETSQRVADAYSFSHIIHGLLFYGFFWLVSRFLPARWKERFPRKYWLIAAVIIEAGWELLENSPIIINRYREETIALGYAGDSILNSLSDITMMMIGFLIARLSKVWICVVLIIVMELGCLLWIRDNLTLNVIMLVHPVESIKVWQSEIAPKNM